MASTLDPALAAAMKPTSDPAERLLVTPEGVPLLVKLAERGERFGAVLLDVLFIVGANIALVLMIVLMLSLFQIEGVWKFFAVLFLIGRFLIGTFYFSFFELRWNGQTPGKRIYKLRVIDRQGGPLRASAVFARNLMREVELFLPLQLLFARPAGRLEAIGTLGFALWIFAMLYVVFLNRDRMRGGDLIAGTWVIHAPKSELLKDVATLTDTTDERFRFTPEQAAIYGVFELQTLETVLRERRTDVVPEVAVRVKNKIKWVDDVPVTNPRDNLDFLQAYYAAARRHHEGRLLFGKRKRDKFDAG
jgi:uncharacterized RDD family membrane protein YckC